MGGAGLLILLTLSWFSWPTTPSEATETAAPAERSPVHKQVSEKTAEVVRTTDAIHPVRRTTIQPPKPIVIQQPVFRTGIIPIAAHNQLTPLQTNVSEQIRQPSVVAFSTEEAAIQEQMLTGNFGSDSTSYHTLTRNLRQWPNAVVVCDLTSSMYPYSTQLFVWFRQNAHNPAVKGIVFFTDCDSLGRQTQPGGRTGRMFVSRERDMASVLPLMLEAARNTVHNYDDAENDIEALVFAQKTFPDAEHLILLADNMSQVKDMNRLDEVKKPVHVVLCGTTGSDLSQPFQADHYTIASHTKGSLHTIEDDINPNAIPRHTILRVGKHYYRYNARRNQFRLTAFTRRPIHLFGPFWL